MVLNRAKVEVGEHQNPLLRGHAEPLQPGDVAMYRPTDDVNFVAELFQGGLAGISSLK